MQTAIAQYRLFHLISPSLPIGSFTYSQGMEWAIENQWIRDSESLTQWLISVLEESHQHLELPVLHRLHTACEENSTKRFTYWSQYLLASRESKELRLEETQRARALLTLLGKLPESEEWPELFQWRDALLKTQAGGFALAAQRWNISPSDMLAGYLWSWLENAVTVAIKLVPLGQSDGQAILHKLTELLPEIIQQSQKIKDDEIGASTPALAIASCLHETQYTRLFRS